MSEIGLLWQQYILFDWIRVIVLFIYRKLMKDINYYFELFKIINLIKKKSNPKETSPIFLWRNMSWFYVGQM